MQSGEQECSSKKLPHALKTNEVGSAKYEILTILISYREMKYIMNY